MRRCIKAAVRPFEELVWGAGSVQSIHCTFTSTRQMSILGNSPRERGAAQRGPPRISISKRPVLPGRQSNSAPVCRGVEAAAGGVLGGATANCFDGTPTHEGRSSQLLFIAGRRALKIEARGFLCGWVSGCEKNPWPPRRLEPRRGMAGLHHQTGRPSRTRRAGGRPRAISAAGRTPHVLSPHAAHAITPSGAPRPPPRPQSLHHRVSV